jgi:hypothetical protein
MLAAAWRRSCGGRSVSGNGGSAQRDGGSAVAAARWLRRWRQQRGSKTALGGGTRMLTHNDQMRETMIFFGNFMEMTIFFGNFVRVF